MSGGVRRRPAERGFAEILGLLAGASGASQALEACRRYNLLQVQYPWQGRPWLKGAYLQGREEQLTMVTREIRWVVRLTPPAGRTIRDLLEIPLSLDVWHRENNALVASASEKTLHELERRRLAGVERLCTTEEYEARSKGLSQDEPSAR
jgi:hypothetical protein